ncbi:hypothetical protein [Virgibacillus halodenitrificans]|uniref:DUF4352 domain-containing protein n=1 Tax=Virgibacillus halodenitrificans TaxID=1482 RepID=A0ABR7VJB6_VIRHA|nr:hypothetical protein [Virgibacillus halodenitrificans]MBD1222014.1 hypothetical protein [Virgibacillus halodenitrificans]
MVLSLGHIINNRTQLTKITSSSIVNTGALLGREELKIRIYFIVLVLMLVLLIAGCSTSDKIDSKELEKFEVKKKTDETVQDDFLFRLVSKKDQYKKGEKIILYGEIVYKGDKEEVNINHASSAIFFNIREETRGYEIGYAVKDIRLTTTLHRLGSPYQKQYTKNIGYNPENETQDYEQFTDDFLNNDGFPTGYYKVKGQTDFSLSSEGELEQKKFNMEAAIDFKVVE